VLTTNSELIGWTSCKSSLIWVSTLLFAPPGGIPINDNLKGRWLDISMCSDNTIKNLKNRNGEAEIYVGGR